MTIRVLVIVATVLLVGPGCGAAALLDGSPRGGTVELRGRYIPAMTDATHLMTAHCRSRFAMESSERGDHEVAFACLPGDGGETLTARR